MRYIKLAFISFFVLFVILTAIGLLFPSTVRVSRAVDINASRYTLYHYIADVKYWKLWMEGARQNNIVFLTTKTAGANTSLKIGDNEVNIYKADSNIIKLKWLISSSKTYNSGFQIIQAGNAEVTTVQWYFDEHLNWFPWERLGAIATGKTLGAALEQDLANLKQLAEKDAQ